LLSTRHLLLCATGVAATLAITVSGSDSLPKLGCAAATPAPPHRPPFSTPPAAAAAVAADDGRGCGRSCRCQGGVAGGSARLPWAVPGRGRIGRRRPQWRPQLLATLLLSALGPGRAEAPVADPRAPLAAAAAAVGPGSLQLDPELRCDAFTLCARATAPGTLARGSCSNSSAHVSGRSRGLTR